MTGAAPSFDSGFHVDIDRQKRSSRLHISLFLFHHCTRISMPHNCIKSPCHAIFACMGMLRKQHSVVTSAVVVDPFSSGAESRRRVDN